MNIETFISGIRFSFIEPLDTGIGLLTNIGIPSSVDIQNTILPYNDKELKEALKDVCQIPRMSTFAIGAIINHIVSHMDPGESFVNVGVWYGFTFLAGLVNNGDKKCIGIDNFSEFDGPKNEFIESFERNRSENHQFFEMDYDDYFRNVHDEPIGFYVYDGNHSKENQKRGLEAAEPFFSEDCLILVDDINWAEPMEGTEEFLLQSKYQYDMIARIQTGNNWHPTYWNGIALLQRKR